MKHLRVQNYDPAISIKQALAQDRNLFAKRTWASTTADILKEIGASYIFQNLQKDEYNEAYEPTPPLGNRLHRLHRAVPPRGEEHS
ncbi:hypothetical protein E2C01_081436 [Portunus trituberculatus]|uniref:Uncharacterized protein n=1 Tax=Portunus trituberculatus TaxID=210409 RepID=A0A5B7IRX8_PORTR|nr:hypothetical protein [Portunus trituberculatus]